MEETLRVIPESQFVHSDLLNAIYKCGTGSGIGLQLSADLANAIFAHVVGARTVLRPIFCGSVGIRFYGRYMDDILILINRQSAGLPKGIVGVMRSMKKLCGANYNLKVEEIGRSLSLLDVEFCVPDSFCVGYGFQWKLHRNVSA